MPLHHIYSIMKHILPFFIIALLAILSACHRPVATTVNVSGQVAKSFIDRFPDPDSIHWVGQSNHFSWQAGYVMFAMEKMWHYTGDSTYYHYIRRYVDQQVGEDGAVPDFKPNALDNFLPGYAILFMYETTGKEKYKTAATHIMEAFAQYPRTSNGLFWHASEDWARGQVWVDGVFMGQIFLARYGKTVGNSDYAFGEVVKQITTMARICQKENGMLLHGWHEDKTASWADPETGLAPEVWSEGMGWVAVLLADVFDYLPVNQEGREEVMTILQKMCAGLKASQDPSTGLWCQVVDKPNEPGNWNETSGSGMFTYLLKKASDKGFIPQEEYAPVIEKAYQGLLTRTKVNEPGFIDLIDCSSIGVQNDYQAYITQPKEVSPFAAFGSYIIGTGICEFEK